MDHLKKRKEKKRREKRKKESRKIQSQPKPKPEETSAAPPPSPIAFMDCDPIIVNFWFLKKRAMFPVDKLCGFLHGS